MKYIFWISFVLFSCCQEISMSKRTAPKEVVPVIVNQIRYSAPTDSMGYLVATDLSSNKIIFSKRVYKVRYNFCLETDVQDIYIDSLYIKDEYLYIHDENERIYKMNMSTQKIKRI